MYTLEPILDDIRMSCSEKTSEPGIVAIDGGGGAGKSTLAGALREASERIQVVEMDDFYRPDPPRELADEPCAHFDWRRLRADVLEPIVAGEPGEYAPHDWQNGGLSSHTLTVVPTGIVIVEGTTSLRRELRAFVDVGIWVEAAVDVRLERGVERDGDAAREIWLDYWMPAEEHYFQTHQPRAYADIEVSGESRCKE
mgnify:CR=1 FL=1